MNKRYLSYFVTILFALLIIVPGMAAAAEDSTPGYTNLSASEAKKMIGEGDVFILDVRTPDEFNAEHIEGANLIPLKNIPTTIPELPPNQLLAERLSEVPKDKTILVYCKTGGRSATASAYLVANGYAGDKVYNMLGGITSWMDAGYSVDVGASKAKDLIESGDFFLLDVRNQDEFDAAHIEGATLIPVPKKETTQLALRLDELPTDKKILVYCLTGGRSDAARDFLAGKEYIVYNIQGGMPAWIDARYSVVSTFVDESDIDDCTKNSLNAKIDRVFLHLEKGNDTKAKKELGKFTCFVDTMERVERISSSQADYLRHEAELIGKMI